MSDSVLRHESLYSWRGKIGLIVPPTNTVNEAEWQVMAPEGVTIHATRMALHMDSTSDAGKAALYADIDKAVGDLALAAPDVIAYGCTAGSMVNPVSALPDYMARQSGIACVTTAASVLQALRALGIFRIALASPYHDALNDHEVAFLAGNGVETVAASGLGIGEKGLEDYPRIAKTPREVIINHIRGADRDEAQALFIACTDFPVMTMINQLEDELGKPVIASNQATFWAALRAANLPDRPTGYGRLLREF